MILMLTSHSFVFHFFIFQVSLLVLSLVAAIASDLNLNEPILLINEYLDNLFQFFRHLICKAHNNRLYHNNLKAASQKSGY